MVACRRRRIGARGVRPSDPLRPGRSSSSRQASRSLLPRPCGRPPRLSTCAWLGRPPQRAKPLRLPVPAYPCASSKSRFSVRRLRGRGRRNWPLAGRTHCSRCMHSTRNPHSSSGTNWKRADRSLSTSRGCFGPPSRSTKGCRSHSRARGRRRREPEGLLGGATRSVLVTCPPPLLAEVPGRGESQQPAAAPKADPPSGREQHKCVHRIRKRLAHPRAPTRTSCALPMVLSRHHVELLSSITVSFSTARSGGIRRTTERVRGSRKEAARRIDADFAHRFGALSDCPMWRSGES